MQIIKISHLTKVAIKTRTSRLFHRNLSGSPDIRTEIHKKTHNFLKKQGSFYAKQEKNRKKVPLFFILHFVTEKNTHIHSKKRNYSKQKHFGLRLTPHFPPYFPPLCGVSTAQVVWLFPDDAAQTIFDFPKTVMPSAEHSIVHSAFSGLKPTHRFAKCATLVVSFHFHHIVRQVFQKKFVFLPKIEYTYFVPLARACTVVFDRGRASAKGEPRHTTTV